MTRARRWIALTLALAGACAFAVSVWVGQWWTVGEATVGPFGARACFNGDCRARGLAWLGGGDLWMRSALATGAAGIIAMFVLTAVAGAAAAKRVPRVVAKSALVAITTAVVCGGYFVAKFPEMGGQSHIQLGPVLYALGAVLGLAGALIVVVTRTEAEAR
jgi:hypothetical protein